MPIWIVITAAASIVVTGALTWVLWRLNQGSEDEAPTGRGASDARVGDPGDGKAVGAKPPVSGH